MVPCGGGTLCRLTNKELYPLNSSSWVALEEARPQEQFSGDVESGREGARSAKVTVPYLSPSALPQTCWLTLLARGHSHLCNLPALPGLMFPVLQFRSLMRVQQHSKRH